MHSKSSKFDYELINSFITKNIITYEQTLSPALYFSDTHNVYNISFNSFKKVLENTDMQNFLLVSQSKSYKTFIDLLSKHNDSRRFDNKIVITSFLEEYDYKIIKEYKSNVYFTYNNYSVNSNPNGFFLYYFTKK
jgi:hypothetical protein